MFRENDRSGSIFDRRPVNLKRARERTPTVFLAGFFVTLLHGSPAAAGSFVPPPLMQSTLVDGDHFTIGPAPVVDKVSFGGSVRQGKSIKAIPDAGAFSTLDSRSVSDSFTFGQTVNQYSMEGTPSALENKVLNYASSQIGIGAFVNTGVTVQTWYVLSELNNKGKKSNGDNGQPVTVSVDVAFQGTLGGSGNGQGAFFNGAVFLFAHPGATTTTIPLALDSHLISADEPPPIFNNFHTVPVITSTSDITIDEVIRSNPFQVRIGVPFGLDLVLSAAATTTPGLATGSVTAESNFFDPMLATSSLFPDTSGLTPDGFVVDGSNGSQTSLGSNGLTIDLAGVPEPATFVLFSVGLAGLGLTGWRRLAA
jgi:hypothetical protein